MGKLEVGSEAWYTRNRMILLFAVPASILLIGFIVFLVINANNHLGVYDVNEISGTDEAIEKDNLKDCEEDGAELEVLENDKLVIRCDGQMRAAIKMKDGKIFPSNGMELSGEYSAHGGDITIKTSDGVKIVAHRRESN